MPALSDDPVLDFQVVEAITARARKEKEKAARESEQKRFRGNHRELRERMKPGKVV